ncbi:(Fe-S)-binding protein [Geobacter sp. DSM 9736]|uniref:heterodisulfide reductase-related iron-sulfur binding cluster n=1 Tax=Geobacter sp. DSM 9736 TaxID=1277350 RepID=UPI000B4FD90D|nr:(Fe-S)-binding protein [Geobacter sp. DSM 9736]SNB45186.1 Fe-S oxidoreductase [Geobacter sp. DSM 9736]
MTPNNPAIFAPLFIAALVFFAWSCYRRFRLLSLGQSENRFERPDLRIWDMLLYAFGQKRVVEKAFGINHFVIFWGFVILLLANADFLIQGMFPGVGLHLLPAGVHHALLFAFDAVSLLTLVSIMLAFGRRIFVNPDYLNTPYVKARSPEAFMILSFIALLMIAYFGLHGAEMATGNAAVTSAAPVSAFVASLFAGLSPETLHMVATVSWWVHALVLLAFICYLPASKHMHILTAIPNCFMQTLGQPNTQPREEFAPEKSYGVGRVDQFTWKDMFDGYTCTECGRCQAACPATNTGKSLNPRQVVHTVKANLLMNGPLLESGGKPVVPLIGEEGEGTNTHETIWSCTTCGACLEACPVFIEQMPKIVKMRRHLVQMESSFPEELLNLFENMEQRSNPWGIAPTERTKWTSTMDVKQFNADETEYLFYVGCAGSFDSRQKHVTVALATIFDAAGLSWGILGREEKCCGESLRRLGNEYVFDRMARENVQLFKEKKIRKIITQCPHCFSTLKNDYRQYGLEVEVIHYTELLQDLLGEGKLRLKQTVKNMGKVVFHDSCYLGRHNNIYDAPRNVIAAATGTAPVEPDRNRKNGFCCGGGGGRMWMEEHTGERININRVTEMLEKNPDTICVSCPYCLTMIEDGLKDKRASQTRVKDVAELVAEGLRPL